MKTLVLTAGMTPQVVTEMIWALAKQNPPWRPDSIVLLATRAAARLYRRGAASRNLPALLGPKGKLAQLSAELGFPSPIPVKLLVPHGRSAPCDLREEKAIADYADALLALLARLTAKPSSQVFLGIAGGRKSLGLVAGQAMSLVGRRQDRIFHVLIEPARYESDASFWWPRDQGASGTSVKLALHEVPFVRLGAWLEREAVLGENSSYDEAVRRANAGLGDPHVIVDLAASRLEVERECLHLPPQEAALLALVFIAARRGARLSTVRGWDREDLARRAPAIDGDREKGTRLWAWLTAAAEWVRQHEGGPVTNFQRFDAARRRLEQAVDHARQNNPPISRLRRRLERRFTPALARRILLRRGLATDLDPQRLEVRLPEDLAQHPLFPPEATIARSGTKSGTGK